MCTCLDAGEVKGTDAASEARIACPSQLPRAVSRRCRLMHSHAIVCTQLAQAVQCQHCGCTRTRHTARCLCKFLMISRSTIGFEVLSTSVYRVPAPLAASSKSSYTWSAWFGEPLAPLAPLALALPRGSSVMLDSCCFSGGRAGVVGTDDASSSDSKVECDTKLVVGQSPLASSFPASSQSSRSSSSESPS